MKVKMMIKKENFESSSLVITHQFQKISRIEIDFLAQYFLDAYRGTTDDEGENIEDAKSFINAVYDHEYGQFLDDFSLAILDKDTFKSGIMYALDDERPYIVTVFTNPPFKGNGFAEALIRFTLNQIFTTSTYEAVVLYVTDGNSAMHIYERIGFVTVQDI